MCEKLFRACLYFFALQLPIHAASQYGDTLQYFAQAAAGGGAVTVFSIHNPGSTAGQVRVELLDSDGLGFFSSEFSVPGLGVKTVDITGVPGAIKAGWAQLTALSGQFEATEFFQLSVSGQPLPRVGVLPCTPSTTMKFFAYLVKGQTNTGLAVANPSGTENAAITLRRYNTMGALVGTSSTTLGPHKHLARFLSEDPWFPGLDDFEGIVELESTQPVILTMLRSDSALLSSAAVLTPYLSGVAPGSVTTEYLADGAVTTEKVSSKAITADKLADNSAGSNHIIDGAVATQDLADASVTLSKISSTSTGQSGQVLGIVGSSLSWTADSLTLPAQLMSDHATPFTIWSHDSLSTNPTAIVGQQGDSSSPLTIPVGVAGYSRNGAGVYGWSYDKYGVHGFSRSGRAVWGYAPYGDGLVGQSEGAGRSGIYAVNYNSGGFAGFFDGNVQVNGNLQKSGGGFHIDHPLAPEISYLNHSFVESPDMRNLYDGVATLDLSGTAWIELPNWFQALNRDFTYQLTPVGTPMPGLYVAEPVRDNRFKIAGGAPGAQVSWQVTGTRQDAWAEAHRMPVEELKPEGERGTYLHPLEHGQPVEKGVERVRHPQ